MEKRKFSVQLNGIISRSIVSCFNLVFFLLMKGVERICGGKGSIPCCSLLRQKAGIGQETGTFRHLRFMIYFFMLDILMI